MNERQKILNNHIAQSNFQKIYLFFGEEPFLVDYYTSAIPKKITSQDNIYIYDGEEAEYEEIYENLISFSFNIRPKVFVFKNFLANTNNSKLKINDIVDEVISIDNNCYFIFKEYQLKENALVKKIKSFSFWVEFEKPQLSELIRWVQRIMEASNKQISEKMAETIVNHYEKDMQLIYNQLQVLINYIGNKQKPTYNDVYDILTYNPQDHVFQMIDLFVEKKIDEGFKYLNDLYFLKESTLKIIYLIIRHFKILGILKENALANKKDICKLANIKEYFYDKYKKQCDSLTIDRIKSIIMVSIEMEYKIKRGLIDEKNGLESILYSIIK